MCESLMKIEIQNVYRRFSRDVDRIFMGRLKAVYAYGSAVYGDLHIGYSDLDFFAVVSCEITKEMFEELLSYRKALKASEDKLYGMLEGEFVPESILASRQGPVGYWGTSGERIKDRYDLAGFSMRSLHENGVLIFGEEVRTGIPYPSDEEMLSQVSQLIATIRKYAVATNEGIHSADWLFLICQSLYWLKTGSITCKTKAAEWAREQFNEPWCTSLNKAIWLRIHPEEAGTEENRRWLHGLGPAVQNACDTLEKVSKS